MIVTNKKRNVINGNTVLDVDYPLKKGVSYDNDDPEYEEIKEEKERALRKIKKRKIKNKLSVIRNIVIIFAIGIVVIGRYSTIYKMEVQLTDLKSQTADLKSQNDNLRSQLIKYDNIQYIGQTALNKLHMVNPDNGAAIHVDLEKNNFKNIPRKDNDSVKDLWYYINCIKSKMF